MREVATQAGGSFATRRGRGLAVVLGLAWILTACGGGGEEAKKKTLWPEGDKAAAKKEEAPKTAESDEFTVLGENPKWKPIAPMFEAYAKQSIEGITNPMLPGLVRFVEKPIIEQPVETASAVNGEPQAPVDDTPLTKASLDKYKLIILVTGVAQPKAVVLDPDGHKWALVRGDALGKEGGRVEAILEFSIRVSVPGQARPVEVSIAPPMSELENEAGREDSGL